MEETLTSCLVRVREDLSQLKKVRAYLDKNAETEKRCPFTWRTIEAFNSILSVCSSQNTPETNALETLLDSFYYLARNNSDDSVWDDFGFELGIICVKALSAIERSELFEILFYKLLAVISIICEHNSNVWKAAARQILNLLINKKFSLSHLEAIVKLYIGILKNIDGSVLKRFTSKNLHLLKTLSLLVQRVGDYEIQSSVVELVFLHLSKETKPMSDFFSTADKFQFTDFENDCRLYLNTVNKRAFDRKVYSIRCHVLYLGGCFAEPPLGKSSLWVDVNKDSRRVSVKYADDNENRVILVEFSDIVNVQLEKGKTVGNRCLTIQTKNLMELYKDARNDDICLVGDNAEEVLEFVRFLETAIGDSKRKRKVGQRVSKTVDSLTIDRNGPGFDVQDNAVTSSQRPGIQHILPDALSLFEKTRQTKPKTRPRSKQLSSNSFVESLNKHIELGSPELRHTYEDSIETIEFLQKSAPTSHKLFRSPDKIFYILDNTQTDFNSSFLQNKENIPKTKMKTYSRRPRKPEHPGVLRDAKNIQIRTTNTQSQDYFRTDSNVKQKRKPCLPKIKRNPKPNRQVKYNNLNRTNSGTTSPQNRTELREQQTEIANLRRKPKCIQTRQKERPKPREDEFRLEAEAEEKQKRTETENPNDMNKSTKTNPFERQNQLSEPKAKQKSNRKSVGVKKQGKPEVEKTNQTSNTNVKPSLLDPNGYAFRRWCKPTTSERSNFWLRKLTAAQRPAKIDSVFDYSEDSDSICGKRKQKKRVVHSKPQPRAKMSLKKVKEILKKSPPPKSNVSLRKKQTEPTARITTTRQQHQQQQQARSTVLTAEASPSPTVAAEPTLRDTSKGRSSPDSMPAPPTDSEYESLSDDEELRVTVNKRERSDEESSSKRRVKKKKRIIITRNMLLTLRRRLQKAEEKHREQTDEIIRTINKATVHLYNHLQRKDCGRMVSYLKKAEKASAAFEGEIDGLNLRMKRIYRALLYYKAGCSFADFCESLDGHLTIVRDALKNFRGKKESSKTIERVHLRLGDLIKSEIERTIRDEWTMKRNRFLRCAAILGINFRKFG